MPRSTNQPIESRSDGIARLPTRPGSRTARTCRFFVFCSLLLNVTIAARGQKSDAPAEVSQSSATAAKVPSNSVGAPLDADAAALRAETLERLKVFEPRVTGDTVRSTDTPRPSAVGGPNLPAAAAPSTNALGAAALPALASDPTGATPLPELLRDRLRWLTEFENESVALQKALHPEPSPAEEAAEAKEELARLNEILSQAARSSESLLPPLFRGPTVKVSPALASEMKDALESTSNELKEWITKLETLRGEIAKWDGLQKSRHIERDRLFQQVTALTAKSQEYDTAVADAPTAAARRLAHERLVNFQWAARVETLRLQVIEAQIALEARLSLVRELKVEVYRAHIQIANRSLGPMQARYKLVAEEQERKLSQAKANEENKARLSDSPLERFRARRTSELMALEILVNKSEQARTISPPPTYEDQKTLADRAEIDFANIKELLDDGKVSRLDAVRLNNEFRRIGPERDLLLRNEMASVESQLQFYENALTDVELELLQDSLHDRFEHDLLREGLPQSSLAEAEDLVAELEGKQRLLLVRRRDALEKLVDRASHTLQQVVRRLDILNSEYAFIRANIFWVRDQEPIGLLTITQAAREFNHLVRGMLRLAQETGRRNLWGQPSGEFLITALAVLALPVALVRLRRMLGSREDGSKMRALRALSLGLARAAIWPLYLIFLAYASRVAPWPRSVGILVSAVLTGAAIAMFVHELLRFFTWPSGWAECNVGVPGAVARQLGWDGRFVIVGALFFLLPVYLLNHELIAPESKPMTAPALGRLLVLGFELVAWGTCVRLVRGCSPLLGWLSIPLASTSGGETLNLEATAPLVPATPLTDQRDPMTASSRFYAALFGLGRRRRAVAGLVITAIAAIVVLDVRGYSFTARRVAAGGIQTTITIALAVAAYRITSQAITRNAWRWTLPNRSWAMALTSAMALRAKARSRIATAGSIAEPSGAQPDLADDEDDSQLADLTSGLKHLSAYALTALTLLAVAWIWEVDMALVQFLLDHPVWNADTPTPVTVGDVAEATIVILIGALSWRYMSTLFAVTIFPRMTDDPGVRFAVVTLCRYTVLGIASLVALAAIHLDLAKIGVVLAALGVGLGFGLQEIVSNFVCGIILLLERPIRIGDVVTVAGTTGNVERINIRATTIVNSDNQSMIVPNRQFITGNLVNWTLKDKILRVPIKVSVAYGTDPERVVNLLLGIARADSDVMINPAPSAALEGFGESSLLFALYAFVPEPGVSGNVRHRLCSEIQRRFTADGIVIPYPTHELHVNRVPEGLPLAMETARVDAAIPPHRFDQPSRTPPTPHGVAPATHFGSEDHEKNEVARR